MTQEIDNSKQTISPHLTENKNQSPKTSTGAPKITEVAVRSIHTKTPSCSSQKMKAVSPATKGTTGPTRAFKGAIEKAPDADSKVKDLASTRIPKPTARSKKTVDRPIIPVTEPISSKTQKITKLHLSTIIPNEGSQSNSTSSSEFSDITSNPSVQQRRRALASAMELKFTKDLEILQNKLKSLQQPTKLKEKKRQELDQKYRVFLLTTKERVSLEKFKSMYELAEKTAKRDDLKTALKISKNPDKRDFLPKELQDEVPTTLPRTILIPPREGLADGANRPFYLIGSSEKTAGDEKGKGGFKTVMDGIDHEGNRVAIACIPKRKFLGLDNLRQEVENMKKMTEAGAKNVIGLKNSWFDQHTGNYYLVMERCDKNDLFNRLGSLDEAEKKLIALDICKGLIELWGQGYAHYDLKPENIGLFLDDAGKVNRAIILDLGTITKPNLRNRAGTHLYLPPERVAYLKGNVTAKDFDLSQKPNAIDVYAFGLILCALYTKNDYSQLNRFLDAHQTRKETDANLLVDSLKCSDKMKNLVRGMLKDKAEDRPSLLEI